MAILDWVRPKGATLPDLEAQHEAASAVHKAAHDAVLAAQDGFDLDGTDASARVLAKARDAAELAAEHLSRARRLLDEARAKQAAELRAQREARRGTLISFLAGPEAFHARRKAADEIAAIVRDAAQRIANVETPEARIREAEHELIELEIALGLATDAPLTSRASETAALWLARETLAEIRVPSYGATLEQRVTAAITRGLEEVR